MDHDAAIDHLIDADPHLAAAVARAGRPTPFRRPPGFATLVLLILEQQVSLESAAAAFRRLQQTVAIDPERILTLDETMMRRVGFSRQKIRYVKALAAEVAEGRLDLDGLGSLSDAEARRRLLSLTGIGPWTADVYLLSCLGRPDVWPVGDRALQVGTAEVLGLTAPPSPSELEPIGDRWRPLRSVAAQVIWNDYLHRRQRSEPVMVSEQHEP